MSCLCKYNSALHACIVQKEKLERKMSSAQNAILYSKSIFNIEPCLAIAPLQFLQGLSLKPH